MPLALGAAILTAVPAHARSAPSLVQLINSYRASPGFCEGRPAAPVKALQPAAALGHLRLGSGRFIALELEKAGYRAERARVISVTGPQDEEAAMATIEHKYCRALLSTEFTNVGTARSGDHWLVVLAEPEEPRCPAGAKAGKQCAAP